METLLHPDDTAAGLLASVVSSRAVEEQAARDTMIAVAKFAALHVVEFPNAAAWETDPTVDVALPLAGSGAPLISEAAVIELAEVLGKSTQAGKAYLGDVVELRYRLKHVWARVLDGSMLAWRARKMAQQTKSLDAEVAAWVDQQLGDRAHKVGPRQLERMIADAAALFEPDLTATVAEGPEVANHRGVRVDTSQQATLWAGVEQASGAVPLGYVDAARDCPRSPHRRGLHRHLR